MRSSGAGHGAKNNMIKGWRKQVCGVVHGGLGRGAGQDIQEVNINTLTITGTRF